MSSHFPEEYDDSDRFAKKMKDNPMLPIGITACIGTIGYAAYNFKSSKAIMSPSVYLMQFRVIAQSAVIGCLALGMVYNLGKTVYTTVLTKSKDSSSKD